MRFELRREKTVGQGHGFWSLCQSPDESAPLLEAVTARVIRGRFGPVRQGKAFFEQVIVAAI